MVAGTVDLPFWLVILVILGGVGPFVALAGHGGIAWVAIRKFFADVKSWVGARVTAIEVKVAALTTHVDAVATDLQTKVEERVTGETVALRDWVDARLTESMAALAGDFSDKLTQAQATTERMVTTQGDAQYAKLTGWLGGQRKKTKEALREGVRQNLTDDDAEDLEAAEMLLGEKNARAFMILNRRLRRRREPPRDPGRSAAPPVTPGGGVAEGDVRPEVVAALERAGFKREVAPAASET